MTQENRTALSGLVRVIKVVWTISIIMIVTAVGATFGWESHGLVGALALGFVGFVAGIFLSSPSVLLQLMT